MYTYDTVEATHAPVVKYEPNPLSNFGTDFGWSKRGEIKQLPQFYEKAAV